MLVDFGERHQHTDKQAALRRSRLLADQSGKHLTNWTGKLLDTPDMHDLLWTSSRGCHEDATQVLWNLRGFLLLILLCVVRKFGYLPKDVIFLRNFVPNCQTMITDATIVNSWLMIMANLSHWTSSFVYHVKSTTMGCSWDLSVF